MKSFLEVSKPAYSLPHPGALGVAVFTVTNTMNSMFLFQIQGVHHNSMLAGILWWACLCCWLIAVLELLAARDFSFIIYASLAGYYQSFAFLVTPMTGITLSYNKPSELNTAIGILFLTWSIWFTFITSMMALRSEYAIFLTLIFVSVAITTGLVGTSHLVAATSEERSALRLQKAGAIFLLAGALIGWHLLFQALKPAPIPRIQNRHIENGLNMMAKEHYRSPSQSSQRAFSLISLEQAQKESLRMFR